MSEELMREVEKLFKEWRDVASEIRRADHGVEYIQECLATKPNDCIYFTIQGEMGCYAGGEDLIRALGNHRSELEFRIHQIERKITNKIKEPNIEPTNAL